MFPGDISSNSTDWIALVQKSKRLPYNRKHDLPIENMHMRHHNQANDQVESEATDLGTSAVPSSIAQAHELSRGHDHVELAVFRIVRELQVLFSCFRNDRSRGVYRLEMGRPERRR